MLIVLLPDQQENKSNIRHPVKYCFKHVYRLLSLGKSCGQLSGFKVVGSSRHIQLKNGKGIEMMISFH